MIHPRLRTFFQGAAAELAGAYLKSEGSPSACKGSLREKGVRRSLEHSIPAQVRIYPGEIIDAFGGQTGQLDGIGVHNFGPALATHAEDERVVLAEGVAAVFESKSDLVGQWSEAVATCRKVAAIRRSPSSGVVTLATPDMDRGGMPMVVVGRTGWKKQTSLEEKAKEIAGLYVREHLPTILLAQLDPPGFARVYWHTEEVAHVLAEVFPEGEQWRVLFALWGHITSLAQKMLAYRVEWWSYGSVGNPGEQ